MDELEKSFNPEDMTDLYTLYKSDLDYIKVLKQNANNVFLKENGGGGGEGGDITASQITDSTATGRSVLTASTAPNARTAIGAGTSNLTIGTTGTTAKRGDYAPTWQEVTSKPAVYTPEIGTTATTAKAGNYVPTWTEVTGKPTTFPPALGVTATTALAGNTPLLQIGTTATTAKRGDYEPPAATATTAGAVKLSTDTVQTVAPAAATATAARTYMVQNLASGQMVVNVPWTNTTYTLPAATASAIGGVKTAAAPVIAITDPVDDENVQAAFDSLIAALKLAGVLV